MNTHDAGADDETEEAPVRSRTVALVSIALFAVLALVIGILARSEPAANRIASSPLIGQPAPELAGTTLDGPSFDLTERRGQWVLVNFFATWCAPCIQEHDDLVAFDDRHQALGDAGVVSVVFDDTPAAARRFFAERGGDFPVIVGDEGGIALDFGVAKVPESYLVSPGGTVVAKIIGGVTVQGLEDLLERVTSGEAP